MDITSRQTEVGPCVSRLQVAMFALIAVAYLLGIGRHSFWAENEAYYSLGAKSTAAGHFLLPTFSEGMPIDKPPLMCWWIALVASVLGGVSEFSARLANVIPAFAVLWLIYRFAAQHVGRTTGVLSALILATCYEFWENSIEVNTDLALLAFLVLCWSNLYEIMERSFTWRRWLFVWAAMGLGVFTKGPVAVAVSGLMAVAFGVTRYGWAEGWRRLWRLRPLIGMLVCVVPIGSWCGAVLFTQGWAPLKDIIFRQSVTRFVHAFNHVEPWYYLVKELPLNFLPWTVLLPVVVVQWVRRLRAGEDHGAWRWFCALTVPIVFVFFSLSSAKRDYYLLPLMPWTAVLLADSLARLGAREVRWGYAAGMALLGGLGVYALVVFPRLEQRRSVIPYVRAAERACDADDVMVFFGNEDPRIFYYLRKKFTFCEDAAAGYEDLNRILGSGRAVDVLFSSDVLETVKNVSKVPLFEQVAEKIRRKHYFVFTTVGAKGRALLSDEFVRSEREGGARNDNSKQ